MNRTRPPAARRVCLPQKLALWARGRARSGRRFDRSGVLSPSCCYWGFCDESRRFRGQFRRCRALLQIGGCPLTFAAADEVEPTKPAAEWASCRVVCWRKTSGVTDGESGRRFVARMRTMVASSRRQNRDVLALLATPCERRGPAPRLAVGGVNTYQKRNSGIPRFVSSELPLIT